MLIAEPRVIPTHKHYSLYLWGAIVILISLVCDGQARITPTYSVSSYCKGAYLNFRAAIIHNFI